MNRLRVLALASVAALSGIAYSGPAHAEAAAEWIVHGGTIYTLVADRPAPVEALAIGGGVILRAGTREEVEQIASSSTQRLDLHGAFALPGLVDAHAHLDNLGLSLSRVNLRDTGSAGECIEKARALHEHLLPGQWLLGRGWDQNDWEDPAFPDRRPLDSAFGNRPVALTRIDGHALWVNSAALRAAGIDASTPDPPGGEILRHEESGEPTGVLVDDAADLVTRVIPEPNVEEWMRIYRRAISVALAQGLTAVHEMGTTLTQLEALNRLQAAGDLEMRVVVYLAGETAFENYSLGRTGTGAEDFLRVEGVKLYADGALGSRGAALLEDYSDRPGHRGLLVTPPSSLRRVSARAFVRGLGVAIHAIGDRGNRLALDALESAALDARAERPDLPGLAGLHARIEHAQVLAPEDLPRFADLGVIASVQPTHCTSDMPWAGERLGPGRLEGAYAWRSLRDLGCILPLGSDFPVEQVAPRLGIFAARTRRAVGAPPESAWSLSQALSAIESVLGFTAWPSEVLGIERRGRLCPGQIADITVFDEDPLGDPDAFVDARALWTVVAGKVRYAAAGLKDPAGR